MKLYTTPGCYKCRTAKKFFDGELKDISKDWNEYVEDCNERGFDISEARETPVLMTDGLLFTGQDTVDELKERTNKK